jgi:hypothetical protein
MWDKEPKGIEFDLPDEAIKCDRFNKDDEISFIYSLGDSQCEWETKVKRVNFVVDTETKKITQDVYLID